MTVYSKCPECNGEIAFDVEYEENDSGDGAWFQSWITPVAYHDITSSSHAPGCTLTEAQLEKVTEDKTQELGENPYDNLEP